MERVQEFGLSLISTSECLFVGSMQFSSPVVVSNQFFPINFSSYIDTLQEPVATTLNLVRSTRIRGNCESFDKPDSLD